MKLRSSPVVACVAALSVAACADSIPSSPSVATRTQFRSVTSDDVSAMSSLLERINTQLEAEGADQRVLKAELLFDRTAWNAATSTVIIANNRWKGIGAEWVPRDPRRGGRDFLTYANALGTELVGTQLQDNEPLTVDFSKNPIVITGIVRFDQLKQRLNEGVSAWSSLSCTRTEVKNVEVANGTNPDLIDDLVLGFPFTTPKDKDGKTVTYPAARPLPTKPYLQAADIVQGGWLGSTFFDRLSWPNGSSGIIGVTLTSVFYAGGQPTDIDNDKLADISRAEIYYNAGRFGWGASPGSMDFFTIITHETGHAFGLNHFGKVFATKKDAADDGGLFLSEVKFAPRAMMNAVYLGPTNLWPTDVSSYCNIFGRQVK